MRSVDRFIADVRGNPEFAAAADELAIWLHTLALDVDAQSIEVTDSINWILRQRRSLREKLQAIVTLIQWNTTASPGTSISMKRLLGW
jgi:hypothetical protein